MKNRLSESSPENPIEHISYVDVKARLACLKQAALAKEWGISREAISNLIAGRRLYSPFMKKLARRIQVPEIFLRSFLADKRHFESNDQHAA